MTQTLATNSKNDLFMNSSGSLTMLTGLPAVVAACATAAKAQLGEEVLAQNAGIPNFQTIWIGTPNYAIFSSYLRNALQNVDGVKEVNDITMSTQNNVLSYKATITTIYGNGTVNGQFSL